MDERTIDTCVGALRLRVTGNGPPAVLWPSLFVDDRSWHRMVPALTRQRRLIMINGPGHGGSGDLGRRYTLEECAEAAVTVLEQLGIGEAVDWVGNAWGGHVGFLFAARWPDRCRTLIAFGTPVTPLTVKERARTYLLLALYRLLGPVPVVIGGVTTALLSAHTRVGDPDAVALVRDCLVAADRGRLRNAVASISLHRRDLTATLPQVAAPTLIVTGGDHAGFTPDQARAACRLLPHGSVAVVPETAYLAPLEAPDACSQLVQQLWAARPARAPLS